jgi:FKBP-type peptidyl-prolyl cis-trans isomerase
MENKNELKISLSIILVLLVVAILVFISIKHKTEAPEVSYNADGTVQTKGEDVGKINMDNTSTNQTPAQPTGTEGVKITVLHEGSGKVAKAGDSVSMNYTGMFTDGTKFDSNVDPKFQHVQPFVFNLGAGQVIKGWDIGVAGMKEGEKRKLEIKPEYGYGASGIPGAIPGNSTLIFEVELLKVN